MKRTRAGANLFLGLVLVAGCAETDEGEIQAFLDDMETPILTASDTTLPHGLVGVGSFDDTGSFDDLMLWGKGATKE